MEIANSIFSYVIRFSISLQELLKNALSFCFNFLFTRGVAMFNSLTYFSRSLVALFLRIIEFILVLTFLCFIFQLWKTIKKRRIRKLGKHIDLVLKEAQCSFLKNINKLVEKIIEFFENILKVFDINNAILGPTFKNQAYSEAQKEKQIFSILKNEQREHLDPDNAHLQNDKTLKQAITCGICKHIVIDPKECPSCQFLFCNQCITQKDFMCPQCNNQQILDFFQINRHLSQQLEKVNFDCPYNGCKQNLPYLQALEHLKSCQNIQQKCKDCDEIVQNEQAKQHKKFLCLKSLVKCENCEICVYSNKIPHHNCIESLKQINMSAKLNFEIESIKIEF